MSEVEAGTDKKQQIKFAWLALDLGVCQFFYYNRAACKMVLTGGDYGGLFSPGLLLLAITLTVRGQQGIMYNDS